MGKIKIVKTKEETLDSKGLEAKTPTEARLPKKKIISGTLHIHATFNNTKVIFTDKSGNAVFWSSSGSLGFRGAKKGTPFAAGKIGDIIGEKAKNLGIKDFDVIVKGVGSGREPAIRSFMAHGFELTGVRDVTPVPHNGPKPKKPRRV